MNARRGAGAALVEAARAALQKVEGLNSVQDGSPIQAAAPYALIEAGLETDWGHKSGAGREVRLTVTIRDRGERPERLRSLVAAAEDAVAAMSASLEGWQVVTLTLLRTTIVRHGDGWAGAADWRARMLEAPG